MPVSVTVDGDDLELALELLGVALSGQFKPGGALDQYATERGHSKSDMVEMGEALERLCEAVGTPGVGWEPGDLVWMG